VMDQIRAQVAGYGPITEIPLTDPAFDGSP